jgi:hypothetical protein
MLTKKERPLAVGPSKNVPLTFVPFFKSKEPEEVRAHFLRYDSSRAHTILEYTHSNKGQPDNHI